MYWHQRSTSSCKYGQTSTYKGGRHIDLPKYSSAEASALRHPIRCILGVDLHSFLDYRQKGQRLQIGKELDNNVSYGIPKVVACGQRAQQTGAQHLDADVRTDS
jgi:hypothetical protein